MRVSADDPPHDLVVVPVGEGDDLPVELQFRKIAPAIDPQSRRIRASSSRLKSVLPQTKITFSPAMRSITRCPPTSPQWRKISAPFLRKTSIPAAIASTRSCVSLRIPIRMAIRAF